MHRSGAGGGGVLRVGGGGAYDGKIAGLYDLEQTLGSGHFAVVKLARHVFTGEKVAVKVIDKSKLDDMSKSHLFQEVRCMKLVQHPNVVRLYEVIDTQTKLYLILELGDGGDLYDYIMRHETGLSEAVARDYFRQIVRAISYCHRLHVVHRDLKPENVVFFERLGVVKLTDFGFSNKFCPGQKLETSCGSLAYSAPEILLGDSYDAPAVDVWSLGVILYMLVCGQAPFQEANDSETLTMIMDCKYTIPHHVSQSCRRLIGRMLVREPEKRATLAEIASDVWVSAGGDGGVADCDTPLVSRQHLSDEDQAVIVQKMVNGEIATKEQILDAIEKNEYNHITATYYLLAERKLRSQRVEDSSSRRQEGTGVSVQASAANKAGSNLLQPPTIVLPRTPGDVPPRSRKCSIVREEEDDEDAPAAGTAGSLSPGGDTRRGSRSEGRLHLAVLAAQVAASGSPCGKSTGAGGGAPLTLAAGITKVNLEDDALHMPLTTTALNTTPGWMSFGKKLNCFGDHIRPKSAIEHSENINNNIQIPPAVPRIKKHSAAPRINITKTDGIKTMLPLLDENEFQTHETSIRDLSSAPPGGRNNVVSCEMQGSGFRIENGSGRAVPPAPPAPRRHRLECRRRRARAGSCSSSDLSDEDSESRKKRSTERSTEATHELRAHRRDSHDDSSDSQERGAAGGGGAAGAGGTAAARGAAGGGGGASERKSGGRGGDELTRRQRRGGRRETRLRESRSLNRISEVQESGPVRRWLAGGGLAALCSRPLLRLLACPPPRTEGLC